MCAIVLRMYCEYECYSADDSEDEGAFQRTQQARPSSMQWLPHARVALKKPGEGFSNAETPAVDTHALRKLYDYTMAHWACSSRAVIQGDGTGGGGMKQWDDWDGWDGRGEGYGFSHLFFFVSPSPSFSTVPSRTIPFLWDR